MLTIEENERLTRVGPGTPMGNLLRRFWMPIATVPDLDAKHVMAMRILGENLVLYKTRKGGMGLIQERCAHRSVSLAYGIPTDDGLRCEYHGWLYNNEGRCIEQPFEEMEHQNANFKDKIQIDAYPVEELGGLILAYMGPPDKKPLVPRWEVFAKEGVNRSVAVSHLPTNWLQAMENSMDPVHFEWLHANQSNWLREKKGLPASSFPAQHQKIAFPSFEVGDRPFGIYKRRLLVGDDPATSPDWLLGHPVLFPNILALSSPGSYSFQCRTPIDDAHTLHLTVAISQPREGEEPTLTVRDVPWAHDDGSIIVDGVINQDYMAWITQGRTGIGEPGITPRHLEHLGVSDRGIILYREMLVDALDAIDRGEDPPGLVYDASLQDPLLPLHGEGELGEARSAFQLRTPDGTRVAAFQAAGANGGNGMGGGGQRRDGSAAVVTNERTMPLPKIRT
jgi:5,5'-dehydrodivanillate O-demethylase